MRFKMSSSASAFWFLSLRERLGEGQRAETFRFEQSTSTCGPSPRPSPGGRGGRSRHRGVGLVELLVALSISAALLTAVAVATDSSYKAYAINEEQSNLMQRGRLGLNRLITYIRTCKEHQPLNAAQIADFTDGATVTDTGFSMLNAAGEQIDVEYNATTQCILITRDGGDAHVLARGVLAFQVKMEPMKSAASMRAGGDHDLLRRATVLITLQTNGSFADINETEDRQVVTLSSSVMPRRNAW